MPQLSCRGVRNRRSFRRSCVPPHPGQLNSPRNRTLIRTLPPHSSTAITSYSGKPNRVSDLIKQTSQECFISQISRLAPIYELEPASLIQRPLQRELAPYTS